MKSYYLQRDTVLNQKYTILKNIGEGGFGITYEAVNQAINLRVAIKELYIKNLVIRDVADSNLVSVQYTENANEFENAKIHFLQEAKILSEFSNAPGIVQILDYFEENNTAYIVMSYIDGVNLSEYRKTHPMTWEETFKMMHPVLTSLSRLHKKGVIHRDISANNIMITNDGLAYLIDFGTTKEFTLSDETTTIYYSKKGYTPLEQYSNLGHIGPWTDIYAIMAVCYECITGAMPPDALQRTIVDEYQSLKVQKIAAPKELDNIFEKGLAVDYRNRYQNMEDLLSDIMKLSSHNEKKIQKKKTKVKFGISLCVVLCAFLGLFGYYNRDKIIFHNIETEEFGIFFNDDVTLKEIEEDKEKIQERIKILSNGEKYIYEEHNDYVRCIMPAKCFDNWEKYILVDNLIIPQHTWYLTVKTSDDYYNVKYENMKNVEDEDGALIITFADDTSDKFLSDLKDASFSITSETGSLDILFRSISVKNMEKLDDYKIKLYFEKDTVCSGLLAAAYQQGDTTKKCTCTIDVKADWEKTKDNASTGEFQKDVNYFKNNYVTLNYDNHYSMDYSDGEWLDLMNDLKNRLDILKIPYAVGFTRNSDKRYISIRVVQKDYNEDLFSLLNLSSYDIKLLDSKYQKVTEIPPNMNFEISNNGFITNFIDSSYNSSSVDDTKNKLKDSTADDTYYINIRSFNLLEGTVHGDSDNLNLQINRIFMDDGEITKENQVVFDLLNYIEDLDAAGSLNKSFKEFNLNEIQYSTIFKKICNNPTTTFSHAKFDKSKYEDLISSLEDIYPGVEIKEEMDTYTTYNALSIIIPRDFYYETKDDIQAAENLLKELIQKTDAENGMIYGTIVLGITTKEDDSYYAGKIILGRNENDKYQSPYYIDFISYKKDEAEWLQKIYEDMEKQDEYKSVLDNYYYSGDE